MGRSSVRKIAGLAAQVMVSLLSGSVGRLTFYCVQVISAHAGGCLRPTKGRLEPR